MKKAILVVAALGMLALTGCAHRISIIDPARPQVFVADGYIVVISLGEIDPEFGDHPYLLAWEEDGQPLPGERGPLMLVPQGDRSEGRYIWSIVSIDIRTVSPESGE